MEPSGLSLYCEAQLSKINGQINYSAHNFNGTNPRIILGLELDYDRDTFASVLSPVLLQNLHRKSVGMLEKKTRIKSLQLSSSDTPILLQFLHFYLWSSHSGGPLLHSSYSSSCLSVSPPPSHFLPCLKPNQYGTKGEKSTSGGTAGGGRTHLPGHMFLTLMHKTTRLKFHKTKFRRTTELWFPTHIY